MGPHKKEAGIIVEALAAKARSQGIILTIVNQAVNAEKVGGSTALRMNVIQGGSLVMLRSDSGQQHLVTTGFEGVDPGDIPASWDVERPLVYDETVTLKDPKATFGLGYTLGPGGAAEMMRTFILESAAPYIDEPPSPTPPTGPTGTTATTIAATPSSTAKKDRRRRQRDALRQQLRTHQEARNSPGQDPQGAPGHGRPPRPGGHLHPQGRHQPHGRPRRLHPRPQPRQARQERDQIHRQPKDGTKDVRGYYGLGPTLQNFHRMTPADFEHAIAALAREDHRVHTAHRVGGANDRGADVLVHLHDGRRILIQCKHHQPGNNVSSGVVQTINGVYRDLHHCHHAVIVTTAAFTRAAHETNNRLPYAIRLIDGTALTSWANGHTPAPW
jgi:hypothetical protein